MILAKFASLRKTYNYILITIVPRIQYIIPKLDQNNVIRLKYTAHAAVWVKTNRTQWSNSTVQSSQLSWVGQYK